MELHRLLLSLQTCHTVFTFDTVQFADSVEWNPDQGDLLACATYQLDEAVQQRHGRVILLRAPHVTFATDLRSGALDLSWLDASCLATADASGHMTLWRLAASDALEEVSRIELCQDSLVLAVDSRLQQLCASDSAGGVALIDPGAQKVTQRWAAHSFEAWCSALSPHEDKLLMSGGDDCRLRLWDGRAEPVAPVGAKTFDMGVTCGAFHPHNAHLLAVGSYDERATLWDHRSLRQPVAERKVGGGVWRLKWSEDGSFLLAAAMHGGFKALRWQESDLTEVAHYGEHQSLAYGADWKQEEGGFSVATCSFYDHTLKVWKLRMDAKSK